MEVLKRADGLLCFMANHDLLEARHLDLLWAAQRGQPDAQARGLVCCIVRVGDLALVHVFTEENAPSGVGNPIREGVAAVIPPGVGRRRWGRVGEPARGGVADSNCCL